MKRIKKMKLVVGMLLAGFASPAMSAEMLLNWNAPKSGEGRMFTDGSVNMRASAWSIGAFTFIDEASLGVWSDGLGVINGRFDNSHTVDNVGGIDFLLLQFDQSVALSEATFKTGWNGMSDTDATIGYANLSGAFNVQPAMDNKLAMIALKDFSFYASDSATLGSNTRAINPTGAYGNTWLIGASFLPKDRYADSFKLNRITYNIQTLPAVPEPATWMMLLLGFGAVGMMVRSKPSTRHTIQRA